MDFDTFAILAGSLLVEGNRRYHRLPGASFIELYELWDSGGCFDEVDQLYIDHETIGGG